MYYLGMQSSQEKKKNLSERSMHRKENQYHNYVRILNTVTLLSVNWSVIINWHPNSECFQSVKKKNYFITAGFFH